MTKRIDSLIQTLCGGLTHPLAAPLRGWCETSRPFLTFAETHAGKLRKKVRLAQTDDERHDLLAEMAVAALVLRDRRYGLVYEPHGASGQRGADFQVTLAGQRPFQLEVTRLRLAGPDGAAPKLARVLCDKIGQCRAGTANLLAAVVPLGVVSDDLVPAALRLIDRQAQRAAGSVQPDLTPEATRDFQRGRQRLSGVLLCASGPDARLSPAHLWLNPQAKHPLPAEAARLLGHS